MKNEITNYEKANAAAADIFGIMYKIGMHPGNKLKLKEVFGQYLTEIFAEVRLFLFKPCFFRQSNIKRNQSYKGEVGTKFRK